ncbi:hypothetical protein L596_029372 [Steinernema carpocapsae]|uniref:Uncharacterized protein n=1 Tax=Steinernema carpocapsae TaxID=34508 RepID=A0A4U5LUG3_STECR|nr:hypothetical protein L596_029372 [Steinernema carpocapsae]
MKSPIPLPSRAVWYENAETMDKTLHGQNADCFEVAAREQERLCPRQQSHSPPGQHLHLLPGTDGRHCARLLAHDLARTSETHHHAVSLRRAWKGDWPLNKDESKSFFGLSIKSEKIDTSDLSLVQTRRTRREPVSGVRGLRRRARASRRTARGSHDPAESGALPGHSALSIPCLASSSSGLFCNARGAHSSIPIHPSEDPRSTMPTARRRSCTSARSNLSSRRSRVLKASSNLKFWWRTRMSTARDTLLGNRRMADSRSDLGVSRFLKYIQFCKNDVKKITLVYIGGALQPGPYRDIHDSALSLLATHKLSRILKSIIVAWKSGTGKPGIFKLEIQSLSSAQPTTF